MPVNIFMWLTAALPIIVLIILLVWKQIATYKAALIALVITVVSSITIYKAPINLIVFEGLKGLWSALSVALVVFPAILIYEVSCSSKAMDVFRIGMKTFTHNELMQVLLVGWIFVSFLQGITGFGVPVAVGAPLLIGIGLKPLYAVLIPLIGHSWGSTFGTLGVAFNSLIETTGITYFSHQYFTTALWASIFLFIMNFIVGIMICWIYGKKEGLKKGLPIIIIVSGIQGLGQIVLSQVNTTIACFVPSVVCLIVMIIICKYPSYNDYWSCCNSTIMDKKTEVNDQEVINLSFIEAFLPYIFLTLIAIICLVIKPVNAFLSQFEIGFSFPETSTLYGVTNFSDSLYAPIKPFVHAGAFLIYSSIVGYLYFSSKGLLNKKQGIEIINKSIKKTLPSIVSIALLLVLSKIMAGTGQTEQLATGAALILNKFYAFLVPFVGALGSFMTSSNMASNVLFGKFQQTTASILGFDVSMVLAGQTVGGAIGNFICPGNIILGATTANILGKEGSILRKSLSIAVCICVIIGLIILGYTMVIS